MLPAVVPRARITRYGYDSRWFGEEAVKTKASDISRPDRFERGNRHFIPLQDSAKIKSPGRITSQHRPLILIAHSFGGLVVLKTLVDAWTERHRWPGIYDATVGLVFLGVPFRGTHDSLPQGEIIRRVYELFTESQVHGDNLSILKAGGESLIDLVDLYLRIARQTAMPRVACFYEQKATPVGAIFGKSVVKEIPPVILVSESSGCLDLNASSDKCPLHRTHFDINKFGAPDEQGFRVLRSVIREMAKRRPGSVSSQTQWTYQGDQSQLIMSKAPFPGEGYFEVPRIAVGRSFGRRKLVQELHDLLQPGDDRPSVVVLQALGGQGKTQLALEYCQQWRKAFRGIFWVDASSESTAQQAFESIALKLRHPAKPVLDDISTKIQFVLNTIQSWKERWLIVYDNYHEPDSFRNVKDFMPMNGRGSIIVTSRHTGAERLGKPIHVPSMIDDGGVELLLRDLPADEIEKNETEAHNIVQ
ncbi:hypothetical protein VTN96DRAFT_5710 [Rasamsonia emersonii]